MVAGLLAGCGSSSKSDKASSDSKGSVYWLNFKPEADEALQGIAKTYEKENGVKVKVVTAASGNYNSTLTSEMGKSAAPTLFVVGNQAAVKTWDDYCIDLKDTDVYKELSTDAFNLKDENGKVASMGYCYESYGIIVNKKLLKKAGYEITDIKDFASLKSVAEDIHKRADKLGFDAFTSSGMDDASSWRFTGHLANMPLFYEGRDDGWKEAPAEIKGTYLDNFKNVWDLYINNSKYDKKTLATGGYDAEAEFKKGEASKIIRDAMPAFMMPVLLLGGIRFGVFTPTEGGAFACMYAIAVCTLYYRELTFKGLLAVSARAARTTSVVMLIVATATAVGWFITSAQIPMQVAELFQPLVDSPILLLLSINVFLFLAGMVMDLTPNVLIFAPVFYPLIQQAGIDPYFFGLLFILNLGIGVITPPVGTVLYVVCGIGNIKIGNLVRNMAPFLIVEILVLFLLLFFPSLSIEPMKFLMK